MPATYDVTGLSLPNAFHAIYRAPVDGEYAIRIVMGGTRPAASEPVTVSLWIDEREVEHKLHDPDRAEFAALNHRAGMADERIP